MGRRGILYSLIIATGLSQPVRAQTTPCPSVSNNVNILGVSIVGAPQPVSFAGYDIETGYLTVTFAAGSRSQMWVGVPRGLMQSVKVQWASFQHFKQALMQERSTCPLLAESATVSPILANP